MNGNMHTSGKNPHNRALHIQVGAQARLPPRRDSLRTELASHTASLSRMKGAHAPPAPSLTGSEVSRRLSLTQDPGQRRTDRGSDPS